MGIIILLEPTTVADGSVRDRRIAGPRFIGSNLMSYFEFSRDLYCICHGEIIQGINSAGIALLGGTSADDLIGKPFVDFISPIYAAGFGNFVEAMRDETETLRIKLASPDGKNHDVDLRFHRAREVHPDAVVVSGNDISAHNRAAAKLFELINNLEEQAVHLRAARDAAEIADFAKSEFLAAMSHELRTPLNAILGFSETITTEIFGPVGHEKYGEYATSIHNSGARLLGVINDILDISRIETGQFELIEEQVELSNIISSAMTLVEERVANNQITLTTDIENPSLQILVDARRTKQVLVNLLSNANKFTPKGGNVSLKTTIVADGSLELTVRDDGIGMDADGVKLALATFGQVDSSLARKYEGTGLGLPLSRSMIEMQDGTLEIVSAIGAGTAVTVSFPPERIVG